MLVGGSILRLNRHTGQQDECGGRAQYSHGSTVARSGPRQGERDDLVVGHVRPCEPAAGAQHGDELPAVGAHVGHGRRFNGRGQPDLPELFARRRREGAEAEIVRAADEVGGDDLVKKIDDGWFDFEVAIATPDMMGVVGRLGKKLGPRGLMPNHKAGTVTFDIERAVAEVKSGRIEFKVDRAGIVHAPVGRASFSPDQLQANVAALVDAINRAKPSGAKGTYLRTLTLAPTMGPGVAVDIPSALAAAQA